MNRRSNVSSAPFGSMPSACAELAATTSPAMIAHTETDRVLDIALLVCKGEAAGSPTTTVAITRRWLHQQTPVCLPDWQAPGVRHVTAAASHPAADREAHPAADRHRRQVEGTD